MFAVVIYWCKNKKLGISLISIYGISLFINQLLKASFTIHRPWIKDTNITPTKYAIKGATGYSFPSNHVQTSAAINGTLATQKKRNSLIINSLLIVFMAFTRMFIGVHTPKDVIAGIITGGLAIILYYYYLRSINKDSEKEKEYLLLFLLISIICIIYILLKKYPETALNGTIIVDPITMKKDSMRSIGVFFAVFLGIILEKKYVKFSTDVANNIKWVRLGFGLVLFGISFALSRILFPLIMPLEFARLSESIVITLVAVFIFPYLFNKYENLWLAKLKALKNKEISIFPSE